MALGTQGFLGGASPECHPRLLAEALHLHLTNNDPNLAEVIKRLSLFAHFGQHRKGRLPVLYPRGGLSSVARRDVYAPVTCQGATLQVLLLPRQLRPEKLAERDGACWCVSHRRRRKRRQDKAVLLAREPGARGLLGVAEGLSGEGEWDGCMGMHVRGE
eukprot:15447416-Alexandrium_andersonii.AAC.1